MKAEAVTTPCKEIYLDTDAGSVTVTTWGNLEGVNLMVQGKDRSLIMSGSMTWNEVDAVCATLALARMA